jgi:beta-propeller repeat-containing protein
MRLLPGLVRAAFFAGLLTLAACGGGSEEDPASNTPTGNSPFIVTISGTHVSTSPMTGSALYVNSGKTLTIAVTTDTGYTLASAAGGTCPAGTWNGGSYVTGAITADCSVAFSAAQNVYSVTPSADVGATVTPSTAQSVQEGGTQAFTVTPTAGYLVSIGGTCPAGTLNGTTYTTGVVTANCTVHIGSTLNTAHVTATGDAHTSVAPNTAQTVNYGAAQAFTLTTDVGYAASVGGTCAAGSLAGNTYTTGAATADCTVTFSSALKQLTVTPTGDGHVNISPSTPHTVNYAVTDSFTVTAASGYTLSHTAGGDCPAGTFFGNTYIMGLVTADCTVSFSSYPNWSGIKQHGVASAQSEGGATATDRLGNVYVTGYTEGALNGITMIGARDAFLAKYDPSGQLTWLKNLGAATHSTTGSGIWIDSNANVFITGFTDGGLNGNTDPTGQDFFFAKYASDGTLVWVKQAGAPGQTTAASSITSDGTGDIYVAGSTTGGLYSASQTGTYDYFVARYDASGNLAWIKQLGSPGVQTFGASVRVDSSGSVFLSGTARGGLAGNTQHGDFDYLIAKYDSAGNLLWLKQDGATSKVTTGLGMELDSAGNPVMSGGTTTGLNGNSQHGDTDYYITKYDTNGNLLWLTQVGGTASTSTGALWLTVDSADNVLVTGYTSASLAGNTLSAQFDAFVAKHDSSGNLTWLKQLGTPTNVLNAGNGVTVDWADNIFATGYTDGALPGHTLAGTRDYFVVKYDASGVRQ